MQIKRTGGVAADGQKILIYGAAGVGKTTALATLPQPFILSAESGLKSIQWADLPYVEIDSLARLREAYAWIKGSDEARGYQSIALDSLSEIGEVVLAEEKKKTKDPRQAYGALQDEMSAIVRSFRDLPGRHVVVTCKLDKAPDELGKVFYSPSMPGQKFGASLPYFFDEVFALRVERDADGVLHRAFLTSTDGAWTAKDRSGLLAQWEAPDLGAVIAKIARGGQEVNDGKA